MTDTLYRAIESSLRKERRDGILLTILAAMFIVAGVFVLCIVGKPWLTAISLPFSGVLLLVGIFKIVRPARDLPVALGIIGCFGMAASGAALILSELLGSHALAHRQGAALPVGIIAVIFFGGGGVLILLRQICRRRLKRGDRIGRRV